MVCFCFFKQKTAYELRISDWSTDVCSSDLAVVVGSQCADQPSCRVTRLSASLVESKLPGSLPRASGGCRQPTKPMPKEKAAQKSAAICISIERTSVEKGKSVSVRVDSGGRRIIKKKNKQQLIYIIQH